MAHVGRRPGQVEVGGRHGPRLKAMAGSTGQVWQLRFPRPAPLLLNSLSSSCARGVDFAHVSYADE
jgi:hypothetical protein